MESQCFFGCAIGGDFEDLLKTLKSKNWADEPIPFERSSSDSANGQPLNFWGLH